MPYWNFLEGTLANPGLGRIFGRYPNDISLLDLMTSTLGGTDVYTRKFSNSGYTRMNYYSVQAGDGPDINAASPHSMTEFVDYNPSRVDAGTYNGHTGGYGNLTMNWTNPVGFDLARGHNVYMYCCCGPYATVPEAVDPGCNHQAEILTVKNADTTHFTSGDEGYYTARVEYVWDQTGEGSIVNPGSILQDTNMTLTDPIGMVIGPIVRVCPELSGTVGQNPSNPYCGQSVTLTISWTGNGPSKLQLYYKWGSWSPLPTSTNANGWTLISSNLNGASGQTTWNTTETGTVYFSAFYTDVGTPCPYNDGGLTSRLILCSACLHYDMLVRVLKMKNKKELLINVNEVKIGDLIKTQSGYTKVTKVLTEHMREGYYIIEGQLKITNDHPFLHDGEWITPEEYDGEKQYVEETTPTVYIETESGEFLTFNGDKEWTVSGDYGKRFFD